LKDSSRKSDSGTKETASLTLQQSESKREAAESRAVQIQEGSCGKQKSESKREAAVSRAVRIQEGNCGKQSSPNPRGKMQEAEQPESKREAAASRASCGGQSEFESESRQTSRNRRSLEASTQASPQRVYPSIAQRRVLAQSMPSLYPNLEAEVASSIGNTASMTEYVSVGEAFKLLTPFKGEKGTC
jgi:hypothetical protein